LVRPRRGYTSGPEWTGEPLKLLIKRIDDDDRLVPVREGLPAGWEIVVVDHTDRAAFAAALAEADAMVSMNWPADFPEAPRLRLLQLPGAGTDEIVFDAVPAAATVCNAFGHQIGIAEYVLAAMLQWVVPLRRMDEEMRQNRWWGSFLCGPRRADLYGKTLAIAGYGRIGQEVARRAHAFGVKVVAASRTPGPGDDWCAPVRPMSELAQVLAGADFVLSALPLDPSTRGVFDAAMLAAIGPGALFINVGRGATVDEQALYEALRDRRLGGAVIDTWYSYPPQSGGQVPVHPPSRFPFHTLDNVVMTAHASAWTESLAGRRCAVVIENLERLAAGRPLQNVVRPPRQAPGAAP